MKKTKLLVATIGMGLVAGIAFVPDSRAAKLESWHKKLEKPGVRFDSKFNGHAQLDKETDLTWETRPDPSTMLFWQAQRNCFEKLIDERRGWRVPTVDELMTLSAPSQNGSVGLMPDTLPFQTGAMQNFEVWWTSTEAEAGDKFVVYREGITGAVTAVGSSFSARIICVRGPGTARGAN